MEMLFAGGALSAVLILLFFLFMFIVFVAPLLCWIRLGDVVKRLDFMCQMAAKPQDEERQDDGAGLIECPSCGREFAWSPGDACSCPGCGKAFSMAWQ